jgi:hypothetical protein
MARTSASAPWKPATEQPGNSFKYLYWRLSAADFQQLCGALLKMKFDAAQCLPVGMSDEGIDAIVQGSIVYQVKWSSKLQQNPDAWLKGALEGERAKISRLVEQNRISRYVLMTSVAGTTTSQGTGSFQKFEDYRRKLSEELGVPIECWWQADIDALVDAAPDAIKWSYQEMLAGSDAIKYLIFGSQVEGQAARMRETMLHVMGTQWREDSKIKFSQVDMDRVGVVDLFVDVQASLQAAPRNALDEFVSRQAHKVYESSGALKHLLQTTVPLTYLIGVPGQGKSTLGQYLSQVHRAAILPGDALGDRKPPLDGVNEPKLPLRVDLKDYAAWLAGLDPFGEDEPQKTTRQRPKSERSIELFLADFCTANSGGRSVTVEEVQSLLERYPTLLVLDGLDEIADPVWRTVAVEQINITATRMATTTKLRRFQILVTSRPNASGLAEPDKDIFQTLRLEPLTAALQQEFVNKWCDVNAIRGTARRALRRTFTDRTALDHVAQLADNPMQLTILLFLINRKGDAVPVSRSPLYSDYMATLLDREVNRQQIERDQIPRVQEVTSFLGWHMHSGVETKPAAGRMTRRDIETTLLLYFRETDGPVEQAETLFRAASDRFWALTSKVEGSFEFAVQPVREYFAARFLAEWAGRERRVALSKQDVLRRLIERPYWLNTMRFYAGFAPPNELAGLRYGLEDAMVASRHPLQERVAAWALLNDGIFANNTPVQRDVTRLIADDLSTVLIASDPQAAVNFPRLTNTHGGDQFTTEVLTSIERSPSSVLTATRVDLLCSRLVMDKQRFLEWWRPHFERSLGQPDQNAWLNIGGSFGVPRPEPSVITKVTLKAPADYQAALRVGISPHAGSATDLRLLGAVLAGWCSDIPTACSSEAGALLRAMRPQWYHQLAEANRQGPSIANGHLWLGERDRSGRAAAFNRLVEIDPRYGELKRAANSRSKGQKGTTEPWQNPARVLWKIHGACLLAAEIAIAGAATSGTLGEGSIDAGGEPFGDQIDYGTFVIRVHGRPSPQWWGDMHGRYEDGLSRTTWTLALLATADTSVVASELARIDAHLQGLSDEEFNAVAAASSRLGIAQGHRRLGSEVLRQLPGYGPRTRLLVAHFAANTSAFDPLDAMNEEELISMMAPNAASWPILRAVTARMLRSPSTVLLNALSKAGANAKLDMLEVVRPLESSHVSAILANPDLYPAAWVVAAERARSQSHEEPPLEKAALAEQWVPKVPRL